MPVDYLRTKRSLLDVDASKIAGYTEAKAAIAARRARDAEWAREHNVDMTHFYANYELVLAQFLLRDAMNVGLPADIEDSKHGG